MAVTCNLLVRRRTWLIHSDPTTPGRVGRSVRPALRWLRRVSELDQGHTAACMVVSECFNAYIERKLCEGR